MKYLSLIGLIFLGHLNLFAVMVVTYRGPESELDKRHVYPFELLKTAMEKTEEKYGPFLLKQAPKMNYPRSLNPSSIRRYENFVIESTVTEENENNLLSIKIPIAKGIYGYRLMLINKKNQYLFNKIEDLSGLKIFRFGQGLGWNDIDILENVNLKVIQSPKYETLFSMLINGRFDVFPRGINEAFIECNERKEKFPDLAVEKTICLYYPLPRFFYTAKDNVEFAERLEVGLRIMMEDGSFNELWLKHNGKYLDEADLGNRKIIKIRSKKIPNVVPLSEKKYWYFPESMNFD